MDKLPNVVIILARCSRTKNSFGIRMEETSPGRWLADWTFRLKTETSARKEGYDQTEVAGTFGFGDHYPGCPDCENQSLFRCECDRTACCDGKTRRVTCPWCGHTAELGGTVTSLKAGGDR